MRVYSSYTEEGYEFAVPIDKEHFKLVSRVARAEAPLSDLARVELEFVREEDEPFLLRSDAPSFSDQVLVLRSSAIDALEKHLAPERLVPVCGSSMDTWWYVLEGDHPDVLDWDRSDVERFPDGRLLAVDRPIFLPERLKRAPSVFTFQSGESVLLRETFVRDWRISGLVGLEFALEWSDEEGVEPDPRPF